MKIIVSIVLFGLLSISMQAQQIKITNATLDKRVVREYNGQAQVDGIISLEYDIINNTKDTLHFFNRPVDPFVGSRPFVYHQSQPSMEKSDKDCGGVFIYNQPPAAYSNRPFNAAEDIIAIAPKSKGKMRIRKYVEEGLCPLNGKKIAIYITYHLELLPFNRQKHLDEIVQQESALKILVTQKAIVEKDTVLQQQTALLSALEQAIKKLEYGIQHAGQTIKDAAYLQTLHLYTREIKSNTVYIND